VEIKEESVIVLCWCIKTAGQSFVINYKNKLHNFLREMLAAKRVLSRVAAVCVLRELNVLCKFKYDDLCEEMIKTMLECEIERNSSDMLRTLYWSAFGRVSISPYKIGDVLDVYSEVEIAFYVFVLLHLSDTDARSELSENMRILDNVEITSETLKPSIKRLKEVMAELLPYQKIV